MTITVQATINIELNQHNCNVCNTIFAVQETNNVVHCPLCRVNITAREARAQQHAFDLRAKKSEPKENKRLRGPRVKSHSKPRAGSFAEKLLQIRKHVNMSQTDMATYMATETGETITGPYISVFERNSGRMPQKARSIIWKWVKDNWEEKMASL